MVLKEILPQPGQPRSPAAEQSFSGESPETLEFRSQLIALAQQVPEAYGKPSAEELLAERLPENPEDRGWIDVAYGYRIILGSRLDRTQATEVGKPYYDGEDIDKAYPPGSPIPQRNLSHTTYLRDAHQTLQRVTPPARAQGRQPRWMATRSSQVGKKGK